MQSLFSDVSGILCGAIGRFILTQRFDAAARRVEKWLVHTNPYSRVTVGIMGKDGKLIPNPVAASRILEK